jgi:tetratricopeptide (TPR) repeat protein
MKLKSMFAGLAASALFLMPAYAQVGGGGIRGKILDREGKPLQGAVVRIENTSTHQTDDAKSARNGDYSFVGVFPGTYKATVIVDNRAVMVKGEGAGNQITVSNVSDTTVNFDLRTAPATPPPTPVASANPANAANAKEAKEKADAAKKNNDEMKAAFTAGLAAMTAKNYEEAIKQFQMAAEKDQTQSVIYANMGLAYSNLKKYDDAVTNYKKSIEIKGDDASIHALLSLALANANKIDEATAEVQETAKLDPAMAGQSYYNLGAILTNRGKLKEAVDAFKKAIEIDPKNAQSYYQLGIAYFGTPETIPQAITSLEKFLELQPTGPDADAAKQLIEAAKAQAPAGYTAPKQEQKGKTKGR